MKRVLPLILGIFLYPFIGRADGVVIPPTAFPAKVTIPGQRALICWSNGVERLAIDTRFIGEGTNFAWVVPLPSQPTIEEASAGLFSTLDYIFRPAVVHTVFPFYAVILFCTGLVYLLLFVKRNTEPRTSDLIVSSLTGLALMPLSLCFSLPLALLLPWSVWRIRTGKEGVMAILLVLVIVAILSGMLLPALGTAGVATATTANGVTVLSSQRIGAYETTSLSSTNSAALSQWLDENHYAMPAGTGSILSNYVKRGWVFVATKLHRDVSAKTENAPHPLCFTFRTDKAVYPMQLTAAGSTNLDVELFVFGPSRAEAKYFSVERCDVPIFEKSVYHRPDLRIVHPLLQKWTASSPIATQLKASLSPEQMEEDIELQWEPFKEFHRTIYSVPGAVVTALNWGAGIFSVSLILGSIFLANPKPQGSGPRSILGFAIVAGVTIAVLLFISFSKSEVRLERRPQITARMYLRQINMVYLDAIEKGSSAAQAQELISSLDIVTNNVLLGGRIHEEDSPGNYILHQTTNGADFIWFDGDGGAHTNEEL